MHPGIYPLFLKLLDAKFSLQLELQQVLADNLFFLGLQLIKVPVGRDIPSAQILGLRKGQVNSSTSGELVYPQLALNFVAVTNR
jgi:hypothetical protein